MIKKLLNRLRFVRLTATGTEAEVIADIARRQQLGIRKYRTTLRDAGLPDRKVLQHMYEEMLDLSVYLKEYLDRGN